MSRDRGPRTLLIDIGIALLSGLVAATIAFDYVAARYAPRTDDADAFRSVSALVRIAMARCWSSTTS